MFVFTHPQTLHFLGDNLNKFGKLCIFLYIYFMLKDHRKPHVGTRYKGNLINLFFFNSLIVYNTWYTEKETYK